MDAEREAEFNRWYNEEHINNLLGVPGFLSAGRYVALQGGPKYLSMYELEEPNVLRSAAFLDQVRYKSVPMAPAVSPAARSAGLSCSRPTARSSRPGRALSSWRWDRRPSCRWAAWTSPATWRRSSTTGTTRRTIPAYLTVPGVIRARRFVVIDGQPKYLTVYEFAHAGVPESAAWLQARESNPWSRRVRPSMRLDEGSPGVYRRIYPA